MLTHIVDSFIRSLSLLKNARIQFSEMRPAIFCSIDMPVVSSEVFPFVVKLKNLVEIWKFDGEGNT